MICMHCREPIERDGARWIHADGFPYCKGFNEEEGPEIRCAQPTTETQVTGRR